jgi:hypothetical protein
MRIGTPVPPAEFLHTEVRDILEGLVEAIREIRHAHRESQLNDLSLVVELV